jgi:radical SAM protein with 4Fe4S-binding SPASM domain
MTLREHQVDYVLFKIVRDYEDTGLGLTTENEDELQKEITDIGESAEDSFTNIKSIFSYRSPKPFSRCYINELGYIANIDVDGKVYPNIVEIGDEEFLIGDLYKEKLEEMWNGKNHQKVKQTSLDKCRAGKCENCRAIAYNGIIEEFLSKLPSGYDNFI